MSYSLEQEILLASQLLPSAVSAETARLEIRFSEYLNGLRILDIGSGESAIVAWLNRNGARAYGVDALYATALLEPGMVKSVEILREKISRRYGEEQWNIQEGIIENTRRDFAADRRQNPGHYIAGLAGRLPFASESFDSVFSIHCITEGLDIDYELFEHCVLEAMRVLKTGRDLQLYPFLSSNEHARKNQEKLLEKIGHAATVESVYGLKRLRIRKHG